MKMLRGILCCISLLSILTTAATAQMYQDQIIYRIASCLDVSSKYNLLNETLEQMQARCSYEAYRDVFIDVCMAADTSWLKWGRRAYCVDLFKKQTS